MKHYYPLLIAFVICYMSAGAQQTTFQAGYNFGSFDIPILTDIIQNPAGQYVMTGTDGTIPILGTVTVVDSAANVVWSKKYTAGSFETEIVDVKNVTGGGYMVAGASDNGLFGDEERTRITPALEVVRARFPNVSIEGPFPPDGFFAQWRTRHAKVFDAIVCMYHDQGLIPIKLLDFENTVNVSLGLPIVRTSVDHGVGYDIAGQNKADPASFCAALKLAASMARRRSLQGRAR